MHAVRLRLDRDDGVVVDDEDRVRSPGDGAHFARRADVLVTAGILHAELDDAHVRAHRGFRTGGVADLGVGHDEVKSEVVHPFRSSATIAAILRPLLSMPPKIGPMRNPPWTLFAAMPEA